MQQVAFRARRIDRYSWGMGAEARLVNSILQSRVDDPLPLPLHNIKGDAFYCLVLNTLGLHFPKKKIINHRFVWYMYMYFV
jgi:hypothetical protein